MQKIIPSLIAILSFAALSLPSLASLRAADSSTGLGTSFKGPIGLQLYSLRADFIRNVPKTLDRVRDYGFQRVELAGTYNFTPERFREMLTERKLIPVSGHFPFDRYKNDPEGVAREAKTLGLRYAGCAWIPHGKTFLEEDCRNAIAVFNHAGEILAKVGIKFFYHAHGYEFYPYGDGTLLDLLMKETKPQFVRFEMDVFWIVFPGQDPSARGKPRC